MDNKHLTILSISIALATLIVTVSAFAITYWQDMIDYDEKIIVDMHDWPFKSFNQHSLYTLNFKITNTSKADLKYFFRVNGNITCAHELRISTDFESCDYQSRDYELSKPDSGRHMREHTVFLDIVLSPADTVELINPDSPFPENEPNYYIRMDVISAKNETLLFSTKCHYTFNQKSQLLTYYAPYLDTSGLDKKVDVLCQREGSGVSEQAFNYSLSFNWAS